MKSFSIKSLLTLSSFFSTALAVDMRKIIYDNDSDNGGRRALVGNTGVITPTETTTRMGGDSLRRGLEEGHHGKKGKKGGNFEICESYDFRYRSDELSENRYYLLASLGGVPTNDWRAGNWSIGDTILMNLPLYLADDCCDNPIGRYTFVGQEMPPDMSDYSYHIAFYMDPDENGAWTSSVHIDGVGSTLHDAWTGGTRRFYGKRGFLEAGTGQEIELGNTSAPAFQDIVVHCD